MPQTFAKRLQTSIAELAHQLAGNKLEIKLDDNGHWRSFRPGFAGGILDALYDQRLRDLKDKIAVTPMGTAVVAFLEEQGTRIDFDHRLRAQGTALDNTIALRSGLDDDTLIGVVVHEARHIWQQMRIREELSQLVSPVTMANITRLMEADAFSFQQKFLENHGAVTGNRAPLEKFTAKRKDCPPKGLQDRERFAAWTKVIRDLKAYQSLELSFAEHAFRKLARAQPERVALTPQQGDALLQQVAGKIGQGWPFTDAGGETPRWLDDVTQDELKVFCRRNPTSAMEIGTVEHNYLAILQSRQPSDAAPKSVTVVTGLSRAGWQPPRP